MAFNSMLLKFFTNYRGDKIQIFDKTPFCAPATPPSKKTDETTTLLPFGNLGLFQPFPGVAIR